MELKNYIIDHKLICDCCSNMLFEIVFTLYTFFVAFKAQGNVEYFWDDPRKVGSLIKNQDGTTYYRGPGYGTSSFIAHNRLKSRDFIKGDDAIFLFNLEGNFEAGI